MNCEKCKDNLVLYVEELLAGPEREAIESHLETCPPCRTEMQQIVSLCDRLTANGKAMAQSDIEEAVLERVLRQQDQLPGQGKIVACKSVLWRIIMDKRISKLAAVAAVIVIVLAVMHFTGGPDMSSVAWGDVAKNVEQVNAAIYRSKTRIEGLCYVKSGAAQRTEGLTYYSAEQGMRMEKYENGKLISVEYWIPKDRSIVRVDAQTKSYSYRFFTDEAFKNKYKKREWREFIKHFMSFEYRPIGRKFINGAQVEGIMVSDPKVMLENLFEDVEVCLWVNVETALPVRIEMKGVGANDAIKCEQIVDVVELNGAVDVSKFEPNIPAGYTLFTEASIDDKNEGIAVQGLRAFAGITGGRYPSSLAILTAVNEVWKARSGKKLSKEEVERGITIQSTCSFYAALERADADVAYYGATVSAEDVNKVLMRWKVSDDLYRVIFGDLTTENVTAEKLAELEAALPEQ